MEPEKKKKVSISGIHDGDFSIIAECNAFIRNNKNLSYQIDKDRMENIGVQKKRQDVFPEKGQYFVLQQAIIRELLQREILMGMSTLTDFITKHEKHGKVLAWRDPFIKNKMRHRDGIDPKYFHSAKGLDLKIWWQIWLIGILNRILTLRNSWDFHLRVVRFYGWIMRGKQTQICSLLRSTKKNRNHVC